MADYARTQGVVDLFVGQARKAPTEYEQLRSVRDAADGFVSIITDRECCDRHVLWAAWRITQRRLVAINEKFKGLTFERALSAVDPALAELPPLENARSLELRLATNPCTTQRRGVDVAARWIEMARPAGLWSVDLHTTKERIKSACKDLNRPKRRNHHAA